MTTPAGAAEPFDLRTTPNPLIRTAGRALGALNARHPWDHNHHFHGWILRSLPPRAQRALDVGCGRGDLVAALRGRVPEVDGIDPDPTMAAAAAERFAPIGRVRIRSLRLDELDPSRERYDVVTMVASLHHMDLEEALTQVRALLRPGGRLLVAALVRPETAADHAWDVAGALSNPVIGLIKHPRPARGGGGDPQMPVRDPATGITELRRTARRILPGARVRRREGFRVTLFWEAPPAEGR
ncbi:class I SAM-dependent methyltransferase [Brachybacterium phenoliresistens]|uniref:Methyltransferase n=1 Tax=Brachybacterium phenoliresistens TaxID=396014 RepID=Z9JRX4_9MICO|nr:class I SAM-dependent methyltransferase [Brachybacterium phenoliresistens]EWS81120.1 methyltransferase [Brachybacterium phenoliresistens]